MSTYQHRITTTSGRHTCGLAGSSTYIVKMRDDYTIMEEYVRTTAARIVNTAGTRADCSIGAYNIYSSSMAAVEHVDRGYTTNWCRWYVCNGMDAGVTIYYHDPSNSQA